MAMKNAQTKIIWIASAVIALSLLVGGFVVVKILITDDPSKRKRHIHMVTLLKPPPPPKIEEKPPEPKIKEKEVVEQEPEETPEETKDEAEDDGPKNEDLGLDADGGAGGDAFGLRAKKGGKALIGGGLGDQSLLRKYAWYTRIVQEEIRKNVMEYMDQNTGIPKGKLQTVVKILIDGQGSIVRFKIIGSSGNHGMDDAVEAALRLTRISEPPPDGMPRAVKIKISSQG
jgi:TonB family protein